MNVAVARATKAASFPWRLCAIGVGAYAVFVVATLPAARVAATLQQRGVTLAGVSGTVWNGSAAAVQAGGIALGQVEWNVSALRLFTGSITADFRAKRDDGYLNAVVSVGAGDAVRLRDVRASLPITALASLGVPGGVAGWRGKVQLQIDQLTLENRWPTAIVGTMLAADLIGPPNQPTPLGSFRVTFAPPNADAQPNELIGAVSSSPDSPLDFVGTLRLAAPRNYHIDGTVATRSGVPAHIDRGLQILGAPDAQGRRPFTFEGTF